MKKKDKIFNYTLSVGFILLIVIFLVSLIMISRFVLSDTSAIGDHVSTTKDLLQDVNEVEKSVDAIEHIPQEVKDSDDVGIIGNIEQRKSNNFNMNIKDVSVLNINETKSIVSIQLDSELLEKQGHYYLQIKNFTNLRKGCDILYEQHNELHTGEILSADGEIRVLGFEDKAIATVKPEEIIGKLIFEHEDEN